MWGRYVKLTNEKLNHLIVGSHYIHSFVRVIDMTQFLTLDSANILKCLGCVYTSVCRGAVVH